MLQLPRSVSDALRAQGRGLNVAVIRLAAMGDIIRTLPAVRLLRQGLPQAKLHWVVDDTWSAVLQAHADLDGLLIVPRREWRQASRSPTGWPSLLRSVIQLRSRFRALQPDLVVDFHGNLRSGLLARLGGAAVRLGYAGHQQKEGNHWLTTHRVRLETRRTPRMTRNLALVQALGLGCDPLPDAGLPLVPKGAADAETVMSECGLAPQRFAVVAPTASQAQAYKIPPVAVLGAACERLAQDGLQSLVVWGPGEEQHARQLVEACPEATILAPPTSLAALAALLAQARLFVGGDSGPLHMACGTGCPVVGIYGPTDPVVNQPWGVPYEQVIPRGREYRGIKREDRQPGFRGLEPAQAAQAVDRLLSRIQ